MLYNSLWTSLTCLFAYGIERDVDYEVSRKNPKLYEAGQQDKYFSFWIFWKWVLFAIFHGIITFFGSTYGFRGIIDNDGKTEDFWFASTIAFSSIIHLVTWKLALELNFLNWVVLFAGIASIIFYWLFVIVFNTAFFSQLIQPELENVYFRILGNSKAWIVILFLPLVALLPDITVKYVWKLYRPDDSDKIVASSFNREGSYVQSWINKSEGSTHISDEFAANKSKGKFQNPKKSPKRVVGRPVQEFNHISNEDL